MSCLFCKHYKYLNKYCEYNIMVYTCSESFDCEYYQVNKDYVRVNNDG